MNHLKKTMEQGTSTFKTYFQFMRLKGEKQELKPQ